jgi:hypothetical protein
MKLFRRNLPQVGPAKPDDVLREPIPTTPQPAPAEKPLEISLSAEQKSILEKPIDPRVGRILQDIYDDKAAAEAALNARRIIVFPSGDSGERHVVQDKEGFWRIVPGNPPASPNKLFDAV